MNVLVVDENATVRACVKRTFEALGIQVEERHRWTAEELQSDPSRPGFPALIVLDVSRGHAPLWERLHGALHHGQYPPLLLVSVLPDEVPTPLCALPQVAPPLRKPFTPWELCAAAFALVPSLQPQEDKTPFLNSLRGDTEFLMDLDIDVDSSLLVTAQQNVQLNPNPQTPHTASTVARPGLVRPARRRDIASDIEDTSEIPGRAKARNYSFSSVFSEDEPVEHNPSSWDLTPEQVPSQETGVLLPLLPPRSPLEQTDEVSVYEMLSDEDFEDVSMRDELEHNEARYDSGDASISPESQSHESFDEGLESTTQMTSPYAQAPMELVPEWMALLMDIWPVISRQGGLEDRMELVAAALAASGVDLEERWKQPDISSAAAERIDALREVRGFHGDLEFFTPVELFSLIRTQGRVGCLDLEIGELTHRLEMSGDMLLGVRPAAVLPHELTAELLQIHSGFDKLQVDTLLSDLDKESLEDPLVLVQAGFLNELDLYEARQYQARDFLAQICGFDRGYFVFRDMPALTDANREGLGRVSHLLLDLYRSEDLLVSVALEPSDWLACDSQSWWQIGPDALTDHEFELLQLAGMGQSLDVLRTFLQEHALDLPQQNLLLGRLLSIGLLVMVPPQQIPDA